MKQLALFKLNAQELKALSRGDMIEMTLSNGLEIALASEGRPHWTQSARGRKHMTAMSKKRHAMKHRTYPCPECNKKFVSKQKLGSHRWRMHKVAGVDRKAAA